MRPPGARSSHHTGPGALFGGLRSGWCGWGWLVVGPELVRGIDRGFRCLARRRERPVASRLLGRDLGREEVIVNRILKSTKLSFRVLRRCFGLVCLGHVLTWDQYCHARRAGVADDALRVVVPAPCEVSPDLSHRVISDVTGSRTSSQRTCSERSCPPTTRPSGLRTEVHRDDTWTSRWSRRRCGCRRCPARRRCDDDARLCEQFGWFQRRLRLLTDLPRSGR